jgi:hypothetical protein
LHDLILNHSSREQMGAKARKKFELNFSQDSNQDTYFNILEKVI